MAQAVSPSENFWRGRRVFLTGHTGFKGGWLALWLHRLGAEVHGFSLEPPTDPSFFEIASVAGVLKRDTRGDIQHYPVLCGAMQQAAPEIVFHLAAQPLVRDSYRQPIETLSTNVMGTAHVLEAARHAGSVRAALIVTTDKCYENREWPYAYREIDPLGGYDPYSASKACAEIVAASYRASFASAASMFIATARAGNVIGGGDWASERLLPDCVRAFRKGESVELRYPDAIRPWQHVLEPLSGYIALAEVLAGQNGSRYAEAWNFGPDVRGDATVREVARKAAALWGPGAAVISATGSEPHEAGLLRLDVNKARSSLGWAPRWDLHRALEEAVKWYRAWDEGRDMRAYTVAQIAAYESTPR